MQFVTIKFLTKRFVMQALTLTFLISLLALGQSSMYDKYYEEAYTIAASMSLDQKIGQTIQVDFYAMNKGKQTVPDEAIKYSLGSLLMGGNGCPDANGNLVDFNGMKEAEVVKAYADSDIDFWKKFGPKFDYKVNVTANNGKTYRIHPLLATDAVHNDQHVAGNILFPHNIGLSCAHNPTNFYNQGHWTASNIKRYGFNYAFAPTVAVSHNPQWGRYYETMGQQPEFIKQYAKSFTEGLQGKPGALTGVLGSVKHFFGDGATYYGADEGSAQIGSYKTFYDHNVQGYVGAIESEIATVMCSYSAVNYVPMSAGNYMGSLLKRKLKFGGFVISDYAEIDKISDQRLPTGLQVMQKNESVASLFAAGMDMFMIPSHNQMDEYISYTKMGLQNKTISMQRLNDAVARVLSVKLALGLVDIESAISEERAEFEMPYHASTEYEDSLNAVRESLVLLKNEDSLLPIQVKGLEYIVLVGERIININDLAINQLFQDYDNIGLQNGGWTGRWQGFQGNDFWAGSNKITSNASSIKDALKRISNPTFQIIDPNYTTHTQQIKYEEERRAYLSHLDSLRRNMNSKNTLIIGAIGESPFAEMCGDVNIPYCQNSSYGQGCSYFANTYLPWPQRNTLKLDYDSFSKKVIESIRQQDSKIPMVSVLFAGRPMLVQDVIEESNAFIDAFLPGTSGGQGVVDAIVGDYKFRPNGDSDRTNTLSFDWPRSMDDLKEFPYYSASGEVPTYKDSLYKVGYGLSTATNSKQE